MLWDKETETSNLLFSRNMNTSDASAHKLAKEGLESGRTEGNLPTYKLSFLVRETPEGTKIAFVNSAPETASQINLLLACLSGFIVAGVSFLLLYGDFRSGPFDRWKKRGNNNDNLLPMLLMS